MSHGESNVLGRGVRGGLFLGRGIMDFNHLAMQDGWGEENDMLDGGL